MSIAPPLAVIPVGVIVERSKGMNRWTDFYWRPLGVLVGVPDTAPWTKLTDDGTRATYYAGSAEIELYRTETAYYRSNLESGTPALWIALRASEGSDTGFLIITHYPRILQHITPDVVHIMIDGRIAKTGGPELANEIEAKGYDGIREEIGSLA